MCNKCECKSKSKKSLKSHTIITNLEGYKEGINVVARAGLGKIECNICGHITNIRDINNHIRVEDYIKEGLLRTSLFKEIYFNT